MSSGVSQLTCGAAYAPFTPSKSGQRLLPTYYRGCWHVVSRGCLVKYCPNRRLISSLLIEVYEPKFFVLHAASLHQGFPHCAIFPTAASRRSLGRVSVPMWPVTLSGRLPIADLVGRYLTNYLIGRELIFQRIAPLILKSCDLNMSCGISVLFRTLSPSKAGYSRVTHPSATKLYFCPPRRVPSL